MLSIRHTATATLCAIALLLPAVALVESGVGAFDHGRFSILAWSQAPKLAALGDDVVRMSSTPALGGTGWVIELHRADAKFAEGEARFLWTSRSEGVEAGRIKLRMRLEDYETLTRRIDTELARTDFEDSRVTRNAQGQVTELIVCTDGPGYVTERRVDGRMTWMGGFCGDGHPNNVIAALLQQTVLDYACGWLDADRRCAPEDDGAE